MSRSGQTHEAWQARIDRAIERCRANAWRLTPIRRRALEQMSRTDRPLKAYELMDHLAAGSTLASPMRVYRALEFLTAHGFVRHLKSINAFIWCEFSEDTVDVAFLICDSCGTATALIDQRVQEALRVSTHRLRFEADLQTMELHGRCHRCA